MFRFGGIPCFVCDEKVSRKNALSTREVKGVVVCRGCVENWLARGATCHECKSSLRGGAQESGIFLDGTRAFGHADCGAFRLTAA